MKITKIALTLFAVAGLMVAGCQKEKTVEPTDTNTTSLQKLNSDEQNVQQISDNSLNDAEQIMSNKSGLKTTADLPCNVTVDSMVVANDSVTFYVRYHGNDCTNQYSRTGLMTIRHKVNEFWWQAGATVIIRFYDLHVVKLSDNSSLTMNGYHFYQDVSGNNAATIIHKVWGTTVTVFSDGTSCTWNTARQKSLTGALGSLILTFDGFGVSGDRTNLINWGVNRDGNEFFSKSEQITIIKQACGWKPCSGIHVHSIPAESKTATITFGFNDNNQPIGLDECPTKYRFDWQAGSNSGTIYLPLP